MQLQTVDIGSDFPTVVSFKKGIVIISDVRRVWLTQEETEVMFHLKEMSPQKQMLQDCAQLVRIRKMMS